ncbi:MAG: nickel-responsive transcriptional regulator NikR [Candidatus Bathyarchaeia archaeon]
MSQKGVERFSASVPPFLLKEFDSAVEALGLDRSKAIQQAMRAFLGEYRWTNQPSGLGVGALVVVYDHEVKGLEESITDIQHEMKGVVTSSMHVHLDDRRCLEIVAVRGEVAAIKRLAQGLSARRGVEQLRLAIVPVT